ncbi:N-acetyltransferase [Bacteroidia bacterium]|nr:N-acetyltransferase [Bacteroidia bacterium]
MKSVDFRELQPKVLKLDTVIKPFESEDSDLNDFLKNDAKNYLKQRLAVTYLFETNTETVAYFCLSNDNIRREVDMATWKVINKKVPNAKRKGAYPAVKVGRLAVSREYAGNGFGKRMLNTVKEMYLNDEQRAGCRFVVVDAYCNALDFYQRNGFNFFTESDAEKHTRIMYYDLKAIE